MNSLSFAQFFRYLIPGSASVVYFCLLAWVHDYWSFQDWLNDNAKSRPDGLFIILTVVILGVALNMIYHVILQFPLFSITHKKILQAAVPTDVPKAGEKGDAKNNMLQLIPTVIPYDNEISWALFDTSIYLLLTKYGLDGKNLERNDKLFDYLHGTGTILVGCTVACVGWALYLYHSHLNGGRWQSTDWLTVEMTLVLYVLLIANYLSLRKRCIVRTETLFMTLLSIPNSVKIDGTQSDSTNNDSSKSDDSKKTSGIPTAPLIISTESVGLIQEKEISKRWLSMVATLVVFAFCCKITFCDLNKHLCGASSVLLAISFVAFISSALGLIFQCCKKRLPRSQPVWKKFLGCFQLCKKAN